MPEVSLWREVLLMDRSKTFESEGAILLAQSDGCSVWQFRNETGDGTMTAYEVFAGVMLSFNDFHMERYNSRYVADRRILAIDHCREGRMEYTAGDGMVGYTAAGYMKLDLRKEHTGTINFPSCHYHGLTVAFDLDIIKRSLSDEIRDFPAAPEKIISRFSLGSYPRVLHGADEAEHIFGEMYHVPEKIRIPYFKVKILELLLYLYAMNVPEEDTERPYFYRTQVEKVKAIRQFLIGHISENFTQEELSRRFNIPMTAMKSCFRSVYGEAIGAWLTNYRMNQAAELLIKERDMSIADIGSYVGYDNAGKFTVAFNRDMTGAVIEYARGLAVVKSFGKTGASMESVTNAVRGSKKIHLKIEWGYIPGNALHLLALKCGSVGLAMAAALQCMRGEALSR